MFFERFVYYNIYMNTIEMHLNETVYQLIKNGTKRIEVRLLDEKRKGVRLGDEIIFINRADDDDRVRAKVIGLLFYNNFAELVADYEIEILMDKSMTKEDLLKELNKFYPAEEQAELGVVGIRFELI